MAKNFLYKAKDTNGQVISGTILAENETAVAAYVREKGYYVTQIKVNSKGKVQFLEQFNKVTTKDVALFCRQLATMINAGIPLITSLGIMIDQTTNVKLKAALQSVYLHVKEGETLSKSLRKHPDVFPTILLNMIEAGEFGGVLDSVLERLAVHFEKEHKMTQKVKSALTYPAVVMVLAFVVVVFILSFIVPKFVDIFNSMRITLPLPTQILINISKVITTYYLALLIAGAAAIAGCVAAFKKPDTRKKIDAMLLKLPIFGLLFQKVAISRYTRTLATMVRSGVPLVSALDVVQKTTGNLAMSEALGVAQTNIRAGWGLANTLAETGVFTPMVIQMVAIGEESGTMDSMLAKIADFYESEVEDFVGRLNSIIEPMLILVLGVVVGGIAISVLMPMFGLVNKIG